MSRTVSPRLGSDGQPLPSRVARSSAGSRRSAASISTVPSATEGAFAPGMFATAMPSRVAVSTSMVFNPGAQLVHEPQVSRLIEIGTGDGPQHVPDDLGPGQLAVEGVVVILAAIPDIEPIRLWRNKFQDLLARNEVREDSQRHRFAIHLAIVSAFSLRAPGVVK